MKITKQRQRPGQTKEQTKLIAEGIRKGIDDYKKQHKAKQRESNKHLKKTKNEHRELPVEEKIVVKTKQHWLPWLLLVLSWGAFGLYILFS